MRKTVDLSESDIKKIEDYAKTKGIKTFTESMRSIISNFDGASCSCEGECSCNDDLSDDNFALLADAIVELDKKINMLLMHLAPKSAGEVK